MSSSESRDESSPLIPRPDREHQPLGPMGVLKNSLVSLPLESAKRLARLVLE